MALRCILGKVAGRCGELAMKPKCSSSVLLANYFVCRSLSSSSSHHNYWEMDADPSPEVLKLYDADSDFFKEHAYIPLMPKDLLKRQWAIGGTSTFSVEMPEVIEAANLALIMHNKQQNAKLELVRVLKVEGVIVAGYWLDLLLEAVDHASGKRNKYETRVWLNVSHRNKSQLSYLRLASH